MVGIEPSTKRMAGRLDARQRGELIEREPGEIRFYEFELGVLECEDEISEFRRLWSSLVGADHTG